MTGNNCERSSTIRNRQLTARFVRVFMRLPSWRRYALAESIRSVVSVESCSGKSSTPEFTKTLSVWWRIPYIREESACVLPQHIPRKNIERMSMRLIYFCLTDCMLSFSSFLLLTKVPVRFSVCTLPYEKSEIILPQKGEPDNRKYIFPWKTTFPVF